MDKVPHGEDMYNGPCNDLVVCWNMTVYVLSRLLAMFTSTTVKRSCSRRTASTVHVRLASSGTGRSRAEDCRAGWVAYGRMDGFIAKGECLGSTAFLRLGG